MNNDWQKELRHLPQLYKASEGDIVAIESFIQSILDNREAEVIAEFRRVVDNQDDEWDGGKKAWEKHLAQLSNNGGTE